MPSHGQHSFLLYPFKRPYFIRILSPVFAGNSQNILKKAFFRGFTCIFTVCSYLRILLILFPLLSIRFDYIICRKKWKFCPYYFRHYFRNNFKITRIYSALSVHVNRFILYNRSIPKRYWQPDQTIRLPVLLSFQGANLVFYGKFFSYTATVSKSNKTEYGMADIMTESITKRLKLL